MKKLIGTALVFVLCLALTGCGNKDEKAIQEVVNGYFAAFQAGDLSGAKAFCDDDLSDHTTMILSGEVMEGFVTDQFGDVFRSEAEQFGKDTIAKFVKEYKLDSLSTKRGRRSPPSPSRCSTWASSPWTTPGWCGSWATSTPKTTCTS